MLDKEAKLPLYIQLKNELMNRIRKGELQQGGMVPTEQELCKEYDISRFPVRQAMEELAAEGYLIRTRGRGTFINSKLPDTAVVSRRKLLGLIMGNQTEGLGGQIFQGFQKQADKRGYLVIPCSKETSTDELKYIERLVEEGVSSIFLFPSDNSVISEVAPVIKEKNIYLGLIDRTSGMTDIDYIGSDNIGGAYTAVRHLGMQGFRNVVFVSDNSSASSVDERLEGYLKAVEDFGLNSITHINTNIDLNKYPYPMHRLFLEHLEEELAELKKHMPIGIFAINDGTAIQCMRILQQQGLEAGRDYGIVGFDNITESMFTSVPLTTVAQNGLMIGKTAADTAIDKIEGKTSSIFRFIIPTQLIVRNSCGEKTQNNI